MSSNKSKKREKLEERAKQYESPRDDLERAIKEKQCNTLTDFYIKQEFKFNAKQSTACKAMVDPTSTIVVVDGPAGSAKTYIAAYAALQMIKKGEKEQILFVRSAVESASRSLGFLPGEVGDKFAEYTVPLCQKLEEMLNPTIVKKMMTSEMIKGLPVNFARGQTFKDCVVIVSESQNLTHEEIVTLATRLGKNCVMIFEGDTMQADIGLKSGFGKMFKQFDDPTCKDRGIHCFKFGKEEIVRSEHLSFIIDRLKTTV